MPTSIKLTVYATRYSPLASLIPASSPTCVEGSSLLCSQVRPESSVLDRASQGDVLLVLVRFTTVYGSRLLPSRVSGLGAQGNGLHVGLGFGTGRRVRRLQGRSLG